MSKFGLPPTGRSVFRIDRPDFPNMSVSGPHVPATQRVDGIANPPGRKDTAEFTDPNFHDPRRILAVSPGERWKYGTGIPLLPDNPMLETGDANPPNATRGATERYGERRIAKF